MENYLTECRMRLSAASAPVSAAPAILAADAVRFRMVPHALAQAQPVLALTVVGSNGTTGFMGEGIRGSEKRTDVRGVPPRGRPV
ncbi:MAG TPA: hypothetical protein VFX60_01410 [Micromonospora sp.]|nr:hypothetical protein [Micromonospora sp.]